MTENRRIINPLLNVSVTGGTFEEFSQNAMILPAAEILPSPVLPPSNEIDNNTTASEINFNQQFEESIRFDNFVQSSNFYPQSASNAVPLVPLYTPVEQNLGLPPKPPITQQGVTNHFRRTTGLKRPAYAPIPGLSSNITQQPNFPSFVPQRQNDYLQADLSSINAAPVPNVTPPLQVFPVESIPNLHQETSILSPIMSSTESPNLISSTENNALINQERNTNVYRPVYHHWFHKKECEGKIVWTPFSMVDSLALESAYLSNDLSPEKIVATDGGRYDVNILRRERNAVYWNSQPNEVRRCSWFHKGNADGKLVPYEENVATMLEDEFRVAFESGTWNRKVDLPNGEVVMFHGPDVLVLFPQVPSPDAWGNSNNQPRPRVVKRTMDEFYIEEGEPAKVDHLLFLVHGIGSVCDLKFRTVEEVVDEFRNISLQLVHAHYRTSCERGLANRVEVLPISWHDKLHTDAGVDEKLKAITLESIPKLRDFTNDTILDVLFYTSPVYSQTIISSVGTELNRIYDLFRQRNPSFDGGVSLGGHSLGSLILFDILCHQHPSHTTTEPFTGESNESNEDVISPLKPHPSDRKMSRRISYMMGAIGTGQPQLNYPNLNFNPKHFFALGSPIGMFVTVRGLDTLGEQFALPTCPSFMNIFHPYDPVAYRIESLVNPQLAGLKPVLIPHHKGRKRMHLELKETMARVGADLKQKIIDSMKSTWNSFYQFTNFNKTTQPPSLEAEVDKVFEEHLNQDEHDFEQNGDVVQNEQTNLSLGILNRGKRIDYVLQEAPLEFFNEYIFALTSHVCYWESEDTMLLILKEIYNTLNISTDNQIPQQTMTIERPPPSPRSERHEPPNVLGMDPTFPITAPTNIGPPPTSGFVKKS